MLHLTVLLLAFSTLSAALAKPHMHYHNSRDLAHVRNRRSRSGHRLDIRQGAVLKCLSRYTFALCDGDDCTDMGNVAAGTACINDSIQFDSGSHSNAIKVNAASYAASTTTQAPSQTTTAKGSSNAVTAAQLNVQKQKSATTTSASATVTPAESSSDDDSGDDSEDGCDADDDEEDDETSDSSVSTSAWSSTTIASITNAQLAVKPATTVQTQTTTAAASAASSGASSDVITGGYATFFYQYGAYGACGQIHADSDKVVALALARYGDQGNNAPDCGRQVFITNTDNGKTVTATVADACPGCRNYNSLDLSTGAFDAIADESAGVVPIDWYFIN